MKEFSGHFLHLAPEPFLGHVAVKSDAVLCELQLGCNWGKEPIVRVVCHFSITPKSKTTGSCSIFLKQLGIQPGEQLHNLSGANVSGVI